TVAVTTCALATGQSTRVAPASHTAKTNQAAFHVIVRFPSHLIANRWLPVILIPPSSRISFARIDRTFNKVVFMAAPHFCARYGEFATEVQGKSSGICQKTLKVLPGGGKAI